VTAFSERLPAPVPPGATRVAVKDLIDMAGHVTTAGCRALSERAKPAAADAACLAGVRSAERIGAAVIVGRTLLHELAFGITGINDWAGTPVNPLDPARVPGGSSSGAAVAVATGEADVAFGSDTGGSIRIPAACCGVAGLKTTAGRISLVGVRPLAPSLDTIGPLAANVAGLVAGMALLEPGFAVPAQLPSHSSRPWTIGRLQLPADPEVDATIDAALGRLGEATGAQVVQLNPDRDLPGWNAVQAPAGRMLAAQAWASDGLLVQVAPDHVGADVRGRLLQGAEVTLGQRDEDAAAVAAWCGEVGQLLARVDVIALPTLLGPPPRLDEADRMYGIRQTLPVNAAGLPALALPVPSRLGLPASLQLVGPVRSEPLLLVLGAALETAGG